MDFITGLFASEEFMPHGQCFMWYPEVLWMHVIADVIVALAYFSIPCVLLYILKKRKHVPFKWVIAMFAAFIMLCGLTHIMSIWVLWEPVYRFQGVLKMLTGAVSIATAVLILPIIPKFLDIADEIEKRRKEELKLKAVASS